MSGEDAPVVIDLDLSEEEGYVTLWRLLQRLDDDSVQEVHLSREEVVQAVLDLVDGATHRRAYIELRDRHDRAYSAEQRGEGRAAVNEILGWSTDERARDRRARFHAEAVANYLLEVHGNGRDLPEAVTAVAERLHFPSDEACRSALHRARQRLGDPASSVARELAGIPLPKHWLEDFRIPRHD
jgi:hypothetical protein